MDENNQGAWVITDVFSKTGVRITVKASGQTVVTAIDNLYEGLKHGMETHGWTTEQANSPKPQTQAQPQAVVGSAPTVVDTSINTLEVVKVKVTPKPDNKVELQLFAQGHKYADLYHNGTMSQVLTALAGTGLVWKPEHLQTAQEIDAHFFADWRNSEKLNTNGKPYKNIVGYRSTEATA